jgi:(R,R)-butanediol dehydrogenase/meso-butanediol dehydrogenase/diacetyl reductase
MKSAVLYEGKAISEVQPGTVKIEVKWCGICGTDLHKYSKDPNEQPFTLGHEIVGTVATLGEGITQFSVGNRVVIEPGGVHCGECEMCVRGHYFN